MRPALLALLLLLPGCLAPGPAPDAPADGMQVLPWGLTKCRYVVAIAQADAAKLQARLPQGFQVATGGMVPAPVPGMPQTAFLGAEAFTCESGAGLDGNVTGLAYGSFFTGVVPPEDLREEGVPSNYAKWEILVPDAPRREALLAAGMPVRDGQVAWRSAAAPGGVSALLTLTGLGEIGFEMAPGQTADADRGPFREYTPAARGVAVWRAEWAFDGPTFTYGRGLLTLPEGSWMADVVGGAQVPVSYHAGVWSFSNATLSVPR